MRTYFVGITYSELSLNHPLEPWNTLSDAFLVIIRKYFKLKSSVMREKSSGKLQSVIRTVLRSVNRGV